MWVNLIKCVTIKLSNRHHRGTPTTTIGDIKSEVGHGSLNP